MASCASKALSLMNEISDIGLENFEIGSVHRRIDAFASACNVGEIDKDIITREIHEIVQKPKLLHERTINLQIAILALNNITSEGD